MIVETTTWRVGDGWSPQAPVPDDRDAVLVVMGDRDALASAAETGTDPLGDLRMAWAGRPVIGFSTAGHAVGDRLHDGGLVATALRFDHTRVRSTTSSLAAAGTARRAGREIAQALDEPGLTYVLLAADGMSLNGTAVAQGVRDVLPDVAVIGVLAADGTRYERCWTVGDCEPSGGSVTAIGFVGDALEITHAIGDSWQPLGPERLVTSSHGELVREVDGAAPADLYREYLASVPGCADEFVANCSLLPLEVRDLDDRRHVRSVRQVHADGSISVSGDVPQGATVRLMRAGPDDLLHDASLTASAARDDDAAFCLVMSTAARRRVLGERVEDEVSAVERTLPAGVPLVAAWSYGTVLGGGAAGRGPEGGDGAHDAHDLDLHDLDLHDLDVHDAAICVTSWRERTAGATAVATQMTRTAGPMGEPTRPTTHSRAEEG